MRSASCLSIVSQSCSTRIAARNDRIHTSATHLRSDSKRLRFRSVVCIQRIAPLFQEHASTMLDEIGHHVRAPCAYSERGQSNHWLPQNNRVNSGGRTQCEWSHNPAKEWRSPSSHVWPFDTIVQCSTWLLRAALPALARSPSRAPSSGCRASAAIQMQLPYSVGVCYQCRHQIDMMYSYSASIAREGCGQTDVPHGAEQVQEVRRVCAAAGGCQPLLM